MLVNLGGLLSLILVFMNKPNISTFIVTLLEKNLSPTFSLVATLLKQST